MQRPLYASQAKMSPTESSNALPNIGIDSEQSPRGEYPDGAPSEALAQSLL